MSWTHIRIGILFGILGYYAACSPVNFTKEPPQSNCGTYGLNAENCIGTSSGEDKITDSFTVNGGLVDILFISDNSGSMGAQQLEMANRFRTFIDTISHLDYRIAITTQDISASPNNEARAINENGALQDGKLIPFGPNMPFISKSLGQAAAEAYFAATIERKETKQCEDWLKSAAGSRGQNGYLTGVKANCTSGDDRPIYAANLVVQNNPSSFIRPTAHLAVVLLTDEDNRSFGCDLRNPTAACDINTKRYALETMDQNETLINNVKTAYGVAKTFSVHAIIIKPGDTSCLAMQNQEIQGLLKSQQGVTYADLVNKTNGKLGSICSNNYTHELGEISSNIVERIQDRNLHCANPKNLSVSFDPTSAAESYNVVGSVLKFATPLEPGTKVTLTYTCPQATE